MKTLMMIMLLTLATSAQGTTFFPLVPGAVWTLEDNELGIMSLGMSTAIIWYETLVYPRSEIIDGTYMGRTFWSENAEGQVLLHGLEYANPEQGVWYFNPPAVYVDPNLAVGDSVFTSVCVSLINEWGFEYQGHQPHTLHCIGRETVDTLVGPVQALILNPSWGGEEGNWRYGTDGLFTFGFGVGPIRLQSTQSGDVDYLLTDLVGLEITDTPPVTRDLAMSAAPNPFNPATRLSFTLEEESPATLEVFDLAGKRVASLHQGVLSAGHHEFTWQPRNLGSGVYLARLQAGANLVTKRLTLVE